MQIHEIIRTRRTALGLTQEQLWGSWGIRPGGEQMGKGGNSYPDIPCCRCWPDAAGGPEPPVVLSGGLDGDGDRGEF